DEARREAELRQTEGDPPWLRQNVDDPLRAIMADQHPCAPAAGHGDGEAHELAGRHVGMVRDDILARDVGIGFRPEPVTDQRDGLAIRPSMDINHSAGKLYSIDMTWRLSGPIEKGERAELQACVADSILSKQVPQP